MEPRLTVGSSAEVIGHSANNLRDQHSTSGTLLTAMPGGAVMTVMSAGVCDTASGLWWWEVDYLGQRGWTAEGADGVYWLQPLSPSVLVIGMDLNAGIGEFARQDIILADIGNQTWTNLTESLHLGRIGPVAWTPDGSAVVFTYEVIDENLLSPLNTSVYRVAIDGTGLCLLTEHAHIAHVDPLMIEDVTWDSEFVGPIAEPCANGGAELTTPSQPFAVVRVGVAAVIDPVNGTETILNDREQGTAERAMLSPDGSTVAMSLHDGQYNYSLVLISVATLERQVIPITGTLQDGFDWSPDGAALIYATANPDHVMRYDVATGEQQRLYVTMEDRSTAGVETVTWSPSGEWIAFQEQSVTPPPAGSDQPTVRNYIMVIYADGRAYLRMNVGGFNSGIYWRPGS